SLAADSQRGTPAGSATPWTEGRGAGVAASFALNPLGGTPSSDVCRGLRSRPPASQSQAFLPDRQAPARPLGADRSMAGADSGPCAGLHKLGAVPAEPGTHETKPFVSDHAW